jgi:hypothetical protein
MQRTVQQQAFLSRLVLSLLLLLLLLLPTAQECAP